MSQHLLLIDASGIAHRAFATASPVYRQSDGEPIGAVLRFMEITWRMLGAAQHDRPSHGAAVFDLSGPNFRHKIYPSYKSNRDPARGFVLQGQIPWMKHAAETMGLHPVEAEGFEADDVIATLAGMAREAGMRVTIVSNDKDFGQLVIDDQIEIVDPMKKRRVLAKDVEERFGVPPGLVVELQAIAGDPVDCYPGIEGCGLKRTAGLLRAYGSLAGIRRNLSKVPWPQLRHALGRKDAPELVAKFRKLARLRADVPLAPGILASLALQPVLRQHLDTVLKTIEAPIWAKQAIFGLDQEHLRVIDLGPGGLPALHVWWKEELSHPGQALPEIPQPGYYKRKLVREGPDVPARIWADPHEDETKAYLFCMVDGRPADPFTEWARLAMQPITEQTYSFMVADAAHARKWRPGDPKADPRKPIDITKQPKSFNPRRRRHV